MLGNCQALKQKSSLKNFITVMGMNSRILRYCGQCGDNVTMGKNGKRILISADLVKKENVIRI